MISLYFHIPFCKKKCPYCHFYVVPDQTSFHEILEAGLSLEWQQLAPKIADKKVVSIYFGGGTPTLFAPKGIGRLMQTIRDSGIHLDPTCEITIEANPEDCSGKLFDHLLSLGINRLSIGVQSLDDRSLQTLERSHSSKKAKTAILEAASAGFSNISIDLMYDLPDQTESSWQFTLSQLSSLPIQHLSLYNLTIEPHTSFYKRRKELSLPQPNTSLRFLEDAIGAMEQMGLNRYEISAFSKPGFQSKHNLGYWTGRSFLGFGPSAFSYWEGERFRNVANLQRYTRELKQGKSPIDFREKLEYPQDLKEKFLIQLRLLEGADITPNFPPEMVHSIQRFIDDKYLVQLGSKVKLTQKGLLFHDSIASEII